MTKNSKPIHFIDCGANTGQSVKWAIQKYGKKIFKIDSFERLTKNYKTLVENCTKYTTDLNLRNNINEAIEINLHKYGVWVEDGTVPFFIDPDEAKTGSSLFNRKFRAYGSSETENIKVINLAEWIKQNVSDKNFNVLKLDIEGAEYVVINQLLNKKLHDIIDEWYVEFHPISKFLHKKDFDMDTITSQETEDRLSFMVPDWNEWTLEQGELKNEKF